MKRRALLVALAAGLPGCQGMRDDGGDGVNRQRTYDVPAGTPSEGGVLPTGSIDVPEGLSRTVTTPDGRHNLAVLDVSPTDPGVGRVTAGFVSPPAEEGPAELWVAVTNVADHGWTFRPEVTAPLGGYLAEPRSTGVSVDDGTEDDGPVFYVVPADGRPRSHRDVRPEAPTEGNWVATGSLDPLEGSEAREGVHIDSGQSLVGRYALLRPPDRPTLPHQAVVAVGGDDVTLGLAVWTPLDVRVPSRLEDPPSVPDLPGTEDTFWFHQFAGPVVLAPDGEHLSLSGAPPGDSTTLTLYNDSPRVLPHTDWSLYKHHGGEWKRIGPFAGFGGRLTLKMNSVPPGSTRRYRFEATPGVADGDSVEWQGHDEDEPGTSSPESGEAEDEADASARVGGLGGGVYAFAIGNVPSPFRPDRPVEVKRENGLLGAGGSAAVAALLVLDGDPVRVTPGPTLDAVDRTGGVVEVTLSTPDRDESNSLPRFTLVVERSDHDSTVELIPEQVLQFEALRNAVAQFETDVETVRVEGSRTSVRRPIAQLAEDDTDELAFRYDGDGYRAAFVEDPSK